MSAPPDEVLTVTQLNRLARQLLEDCFPSVGVLGEISNFARPSSGHWYFTLKDENAQIRCAMFRSRNQQLRFTPEAGQQVQARGRVSLYEGRGDYQLIVDSLQPAGAGALAIAFEKLKQELSAAGLFDPAHKKPLPDSIRHIAVITSPGGAAIRDVLSVLQRRWPSMQVTVLPAMVQGDAAAPQISAAIHQANRLASNNQLDIDLILLTRGGGSLEDLWPFNERIVAQAVYDSELPVICAVGHEIDFSIADFVADVRAATPSAAAELISPDQREIASGIEKLQCNLLSALRRRLQQRAERLHSLKQRIRHPGQRLREQAQRLDEQEMRLRRAWQQRHGSLLERVKASSRQLEAYNPARQLRQQRIQVSQFEQRLTAQLRTKLQHSHHQLRTLTQMLRSLSPDNTLQRGFAIVTSGDGRVISDSSQLSSGDRVHTRLAKGEFEAVVEKTERR